MSTVAFNPKYMEVGVLTAALQELTPREVRDKDPDQAIVDWIKFAATKLGVKNLQLSAAFHPDLTDIPKEAMLDPVANHLDLREPFTKERAKRVLAVCAVHGVTIKDIGYFDNMLVGDETIRQQKHDFMHRGMDAAVMLKANVCGFVGRNLDHEMDENLVDFREWFIPLLQEAKNRDLIYLVENCPMPGWTIKDSFINNIACNAGMWMKLYDICEEEDVDDHFRIYYDPSHDILQGIDPCETFKILYNEGYNKIIGGFHVKGQVMNAEGLATWGYHGQLVDRGDWINGRPAINPTLQSNAWKKQTTICEHELPGTAEYNPIAMLQNRTVDWFGLFRAAYDWLDIDWEHTSLIVEHEYPPARKQDPDWLAPLLAGSIRYIKHIAQAAADMEAIQYEVMPSMELKYQEVNTSED